MRLGMKWLKVLAVCNVALIPTAANGQAEPPPRVVIAGGTAKAAGESLKRLLAEQNFKVSASDRRIVLTQDRGRVPQATGEALRVRLEVGIDVVRRADSLEL